jgi:hypothetical protein
MWGTSQRGNGDIVMAIPEVIRYAGMLRVYCKHLFEQGGSFELFGACLV